MSASCCWCYLTVVFLVSAPSFLSCLLVKGAQVALVEVLLRERRDVSTVLQGEVLEATWESSSVPEKHNQQQEHDLEGDLILVQDEEPQVSRGKGGGVQAKDQEPWIGVVPVKMKRALVLGASALIILALNQNTVREMDLSQVLSKPVIVIQTSENVTKLIGALLRGLHATAKITYKTILQDNLGATLTLWSTCGLSRGGLYGEWQGVICTGETNSQVQKYLHQLWNTVLLVALILCTGVIVQARWQYQDNQLNDDLELPKQDILKRLSSLKTRMYRCVFVCCPASMSSTGTVWIRGCSCSTPVLCVNAAYSVYPPRLALWQAPDGPCPSSTPGPSSTLCSLAGQPGGGVCLLGSGLGSPPAHAIPGILHSLEQIRCPETDKPPGYLDSSGTLDSLCVAILRKVMKTARWTQRCMSATAGEEGSEEGSNPRGAWR
ncbi:unnamed protein product, partial [Coregonus sp. 'balchen']